MWELITIFVVNSILAFFVFLAAVKMAIATNPDFGMWLLDKLENLVEKLEEKQMEMEKENEPKES